MSEEVDIPFNDWSKGKLREGHKHATTRTKRYGHDGNHFECVGATFQITCVVKVPLRVVANHFFRQEGCSSKQEFIEIWEDIHYRNGYDPEWKVWLHLFRRREWWKP